MYNIYVKLAKDNTTTAGITYKELYDCIWDPMALTFLNFYKYFGLMMACIGRNCLN